MTQPELEMLADKVTASIIEEVTLYLADGFGAKAHLKTAYKRAKIAAALRKARAALVSLRPSEMGGEK